MQKGMTIKIIVILSFMVPLTTSSAHHHKTKDAKHEKIKNDDGDMQIDEVKKTDKSIRINQDVKSDSKPNENT